MLFLLYIPYYIYRKNKSKRKEKEKEAEDRRRERNRAKDAAAILASSSPLFRFACCPHRPHHRSPPHPSASGRCHRYTSPSTEQQQKEGQRLELSAILPPLACVPLPAAPFCLPCSLFVLISSARSCLSFCPPRSLCQVVRGRADHQPGQAIPSRSSCRPSPPCRGWRPAPRLAL